MSAQTKVKPPPGLGTDGRQLHRAVTGNYELRVDEVKVLEIACREADLIEAMGAELVEAGVTVRGRYAGSRVPNPLIAELRQHRRLYAQLLAQLGLPDEPAAQVDAAVERSTQARRAARARWSG
jgi:hypothetical protein